MAKKNSPTKRKIDAGNSYIEGSVKLEHGDLVGGDKVGLTPSEMIELIQTITKNLSPNYQDPDRLAKVLHEFKNYHQTLYEWKELHNALDEILNSYNQFYSQVHRLNGAFLKPNLKDTRVLNNLKLLWIPVSQEIDNLLEFAQNIKIIGEPFQKKDGQFAGESWAINFYLLRGDMEELLNPIKDSKSHFGKPRSWDTLYELAGVFYNKSLNSLHWGDKKLRESATELYYLSETVFQRQ